MQEVIELLFEGQARAGARARTTGRSVSGELCPELLEGTAAVCCFDAQRWNLIIHQTAREIVGLHITTADLPLLVAAAPRLASPLTLLRF